MATEVYQPPQIVSDDTGIYFASYPSANSTTRTNICLQSEDFETTWQLTRSSVTGTAVAPDGFQTASVWTEDATASNTHDVRQTITTVAATSYIFSIFAKQKERKRISMRCDASANDGAVFDLSTGTIITQNLGATATIEAYPNGWYRCSVPYTSGSTSEIMYVFLMLDTDTVPAAAHNGDGASGMYIWGAQLEASASVTSYIRTKASAVPSPRLTSFYSDPNNVVFVGDAQIVGRVPVVSVA